MSDNGHVAELDSQVSPEMNIDIIETTDENGQIHIFEKIEEYEMDNQRYALLIYQGDDEEDEPEEDLGYDEEIVVMRIMKDVDQATEIFEAIEDEAEFQKVVKMIEESGFSDQPEFDYDLITEPESDAKAE